MTVRRPDRAQEDLFDSAPRPVAAQDLEIAPRATAPLGKDQLGFNRLIAKVGALRDTLAEWASFEEHHHRQVVEQLAPLQREFSGKRRELVLSLAAILRGKAGGGVSGGAERRSLRDYLLGVAAAHLDEVPDDPEIVALYDEYADRGFAEQQELERELERTLARDLAERMLGVELDDQDLEGSLEDMMAAGMARARAADEALEEAARRARGGKAREREAKKAAAAEQAALEVSQSVREVFRKLASALHPDRAADEADRARRHELMQRVNHAYDKRDLLSLLTLQFETEQIDAWHLARVSQERLRHYNTVLRDQVRELEQELAAVRNRFRMLLDSPYADVTPARVAAALKRDVAGARRELRELAAHHEMMLHAVPRRQWLQHYARERRADERREARMLDPFSDDGFDPFERPAQDVPPPRKRRKARKPVR